jgi:predicted TIM-barrel fold metal-dependent hydrolase
MPAKRLEGRDEPILDPEIPIVDSHHHLFDRPELRYLLDEYLADAKAGHRIVASVYLETVAFARQDGPEVMRPLGEVEFANGVAAMSASGRYGDIRVCAGIVGYADLRHGDAVGDLLDAAIERAPERFRGVRQVTIEYAGEAPFRLMMNPPKPGILRSSGFPAGLRQLSKRGLSFDACVFHPQLPEIAALADAFPDLTFVLNHLGFPVAMDLDEQGRAAVFREWGASMRDLARRPNVVCKVGGLGMPWCGFRFEQRPDPVGYLELADAWGPCVETAIEAFGADRCMMESNLPPDGRSCGFVPLWNAMKHIVRGYTADEKAALFHRTAIRVYRLQLPEHFLNPSQQPAAAIA